MMKNNLEEYARKHIESCHLKIRLLQSEISIWQNCKSELTDLEAYRICGKTDNSFAQSLYKLNLEDLTEKQVLWLHILANRNIDLREIDPSQLPQPGSNEGNYKSQYPVKDVAKLAKTKGMHFRKALLDKLPIYELSDTSDFKEVLTYTNTKSVVMFLTANDLSCDAHKAYGYKR